MNLSFDALDYGRADVSRGLQLPAGETYLPRGRVEAVYVVDEHQRAGGRPWRVSFDPAFIGSHPNERVWKGRVLHVFRVLWLVVTDLANLGCRPVYAGKREGDEIEVVLWRHAKNPTVLTEVRGWRLGSVHEIDWGRQCLKGSDPALCVIDDWGAWPRRRNGK